MRLHFMKYLLVGALACAPIGCEPRPVVDEEPDATGTDVNVETDADRPGTPPEPETDVEVDADLQGQAPDATDQPNEPQ